MLYEISTAAVETSTSATRVAGKNDLVLLLAPNPRHSTIERLELRLRVWRRRTRLDAALADGAAPTDEPALALRAEQLTRMPTRRSIANALQNLLEAAEAPAEAWGMDGPRPPLKGGAVIDAREELLTLSDRLRAPGAIRPQGAALAALMVFDSASPVYATRTGTSVAHWAETAIDAMD